MSRRDVHRCSVCSLSRRVEQLCDEESKMRPQVWNPGFDVTPAKLITGIITEHGIIQQQDGIIDVNSFLREHGLLDAEQPTENGTLSFTLSQSLSHILPLLLCPCCVLARIVLMVARRCCNAMFFSQDSRVLCVRDVQQCADQQDPGLQSARHRHCEGLSGRATRLGRSCWPQRQPRCLDCAHLSCLPFKHATCLIL